MQTRGGWRNVIAEKIANQPVSGSAASNVHILTQDNLSQYQNPTSSSSTTTQPSDCCITVIDPPDFPFTENVGFLIPISQNDYLEFFFNLFWTSKVVAFIVNKTNCYAEKVLNETIIRRRLHYKDWKTTAVEIQKFIGLLLHIGIVNLPRVSDYWSTDHFLRHISGQIQWVKISAYYCFYSCTLKSRETMKGLTKLLI